MKLFKSIFGGGEAAGRYPESLIEAAIERAVDGTDSRLRLLVDIDPAELPPREDLLAAAARYQY